MKNSVLLSLDWDCFGLFKTTRHLGGSCLKLKSSGADWLKVSTKGSNCNNLYSSGGNVKLFFVCITI